MVPFADAIVLVWLALHGPAAASSQPVPGTSLRAFTVPKLGADGPGFANEDELMRRVRTDAPQAPRSTSTVTGVAGLGYVQYADFGAEVIAAGTIAGLDLQLDSLVTFGSQGARFDSGTVSLADAERRWRADAGDLFSNLHGPVRGIRLTWQAGDRWQPALSLDGPRPGSIDRRTRLVYHDHLRLGPLRFDGELAMDGSHFIRSRFTAARRLDIEASYRRVREPASLREGGIHAGLHLWRGFSVAAGVFRSERSGDSSEWRTVAVRIPIHRSFGLTLERAFTTTARSSDVMSAVMVDVRAGSLMFFHRYQWGAFDYVQPGLGTLNREQLQSVASYTAGPRLNVTMQVASQWMSAGRAQNWLELQTNVRVTRTTHLEVASPLPGAFDADRVRVRLDQDLPGRLSVFAEYGRPSAYQTVPDGLQQPRFKVMLRRSWGVTTPATGGVVRGLVLDYVGRPVAGVRVRLGDYTADSDAHGAYVFTHVPRGEFDLSLDPALLPADYAWDGRARRLAVTPSTRATIDLIVAPLNAIHGRVFADLNGNGRFDQGEGVVAAVLFLGDRVTATNADGAYDFYNVLPGLHVVRLDVARLPAAFDSKSPTSISVDLPDDRPVTGADFVVVARGKTVIWREVK